MEPDYSETFMHTYNLEPRLYSPCLDQSEGKLSYAHWIYSTSSFSFFPFVENGSVKKAHVLIFLSFFFFFHCKENLKGDTHGRRQLVSWALLLGALSPLKDDA
jgi:hypothetical protein